MNVLMYHFISAVKDSSLFLGVHGFEVGDFEDQISFLTKNKTVINETDIKISISTQDYLDDNYVYLTFDDGFKQHFDNVYPVLKDYGVQASFFVPTMGLETGKTPIVEKQRLLQYNLFSSYQEFLDIFCNLARVKSKAGHSNIFYSNDENINNSQDYLKEYDFYSNEERFFRLLRNEYLSIEDFEDVINNMFSKFYSNEKKFIDEYYMSISDLKTMSNNGMVIGGHSYSHPFLNKIPVNEMQQEIDRSMLFLRRKVDKSINSFAYPFGAFNDNVVDYLRQSGLDYAFDTRSQGENSQYNLKRNDAASYFKI